MASGGVTGEFRGRTLVLTLDNGPGNPLDARLRAALLRLIEGSDCRAIVLAATGPTFSSALPLDPDHADPPLVELCAAIAGASVPVVAAVHGLAMGAGAELVLAAGARIAGPQARIALTEIALGLCPEAGTTRRLPALVGAATGLRLLLTGRAVAADEALALGLVDRVSKGPLLDEAVAFAEHLADTPPPPRRTEPATTFQAAIAAARRANPRALPAVGRIIDCVEAGLLLPAEAAQAFETVAREDLEETPESLALRDAAKAERRAIALPPAVARAGAAAVLRIALMGQAPAMAQLARAALAQGIAVSWLHPDPETMAAETAGPQGTVMTFVSDPAALSGVPFQVCSTRSDTALLRRMAPDAAVLVLGGAEGEMGLSIAPSGRASELSVMAEEAPEAIATAAATLRRMGLPPLLVGNRPILGEKVSAAGRSALWHLAARGITRRQLATALAEIGMTLPARLPENQTDMMPAGGTPVPDIPAPEIRSRWLAAMANEGLRLLDQGIARRPSDIDHALVAGHGFPRWLGGPMYQAELRGLLVLRHDLRRWSVESALWMPAPLLDRLIHDGLRLSVLNH